MKTSVLHIKVSSDAAARLKALSRKREMPVGELVRSALQQCYQIDTEELDETKRRALSAYQGGYISLGKLAEEMGMHALDMRNWLAEHDIAQGTAYHVEDEAHA